jgi:hypothetical protein
VGHFCRAPRPEQALGDPLALDIRSDVYALGVILYELLAGRLPYNTNGKPLPEAVRIVREEEPVRLSSMNRAYRGDIDTIVAKALEKDEARRYSSAAELVGDIRRYLTNEPITARPPSASYHLQKFVRRHKALVAGAAAVFLVLAAGVAASTWEAVKARRAEQAALSEKQRADAEAATAKAVNDFVQNDMLAQASASSQASPSTKPDPHLEVRTALDRAAVLVAAGEGATLAGPGGPHRHRSMAVSGAQPLARSHRRARAAIWLTAGSPMRAGKSEADLVWEREYSPLSARPNKPDKDFC